jgi:hypothetical protein
MVLLITVFSRLPPALIPASYKQLPGIQLYIILFKQNSCKFLSICALNPSIYQSSFSNHISTLCRASENIFSSILIQRETEN